MSMYPRPDWPEALATVTECHYDAGAGRAMAFGLPTGKHFRITYNYWAPNTDGKEELHTGEFSSPFAMPQGRLFAVNYNPAAPRQHKSLNPKLPSQTPNVAFGIAGSIILSIVWFIYMRSCH